jgi:hypothetical protein
MTNSPNVEGVIVLETTVLGAAVEGALNKVIIIYDKRILVTLFNHC